MGLISSLQPGTAAAEDLVPVTPVLPASLPAEVLDPLVERNGFAIVDVSRDG
jgi:hypothetical protein